MIKELCYYTGWFLKTTVLRKKIPIISALILNNTCNLHCQHCSVSNLGDTPATFSEVKSDIDLLYSKGARILLITGGEPFLWSDNNYKLNDVINYAKKLGFFRVGACTNGTFPLESTADYLFVSLDGDEASHNDLRNKEIFQTVVDHISTSKHDEIYITYTITKLNVDMFEGQVKNIFNIPNVKSVTINLFTPYVGLDKSELRLSSEEKQDALKRMLKLKLQYPKKILNSKVGIQTLLSDAWERPVWGGIVVDRGQLSSCCCRTDICDEISRKDCGCVNAAETWALQTLKPSVILEYIQRL